MTRIDSLRLSVRAFLACALLAGVHQSSAFAQQATTGAGAWTTKTPLPAATAGPAAGVVNGQLYVIGGAALGASATTAVQIYDPLTDSWYSGPPAPTARSYAGAAVIDGKIYVVGGCIASDCVPGLTNILEEFDPTTGTWTTKAPMPTPRFDANVGAIDGKLYVAGGVSTCGVCSIVSAVEVYDPSTDTWAARAPMPLPQGFTGGGVIGGKLYVAGGRTSSEDWTATTQVYDPAADQWTTVASMPSPSFGAAVAAGDGLLYVVGGQTMAGTLLNTTFVYNPVTGLWMTAAASPTARGGAGAAAINGVVYVAGGNADTPQLTTISTLEAFTPAPTLVSMTLSPADTTIDVGQSVTYTLTGTFSDGATKIIGPGSGAAIPVTYSISPAIATLDGTGTATATAAGTATVTAVATPDGGAPVTATATLHVNNPDTIPPTTTATVQPAPNANGWNNGPVSIALNATDNAGGSGVASIVYSFSGAQSGTGTIAGSIANFSVAAQGATMLTYHAVDNAGNAELPKTVDILIDETPPLQTVPAPITVDATSPSGATVTFTVSSTDVDSGINSNSISMPSGSLFPIGTTTVIYTSTDRAGNIATSTFTVTVLSAMQMTANLIGSTTAAGFQQGTSLLQNVYRKLQPLTSVFAPLALTSTAAPAAIAAPIAACNQLQAFVNQTNAQSGTHLSGAQAAAFALEAARIAAAAGCR